MEKGYRKLVFMVFITFKCPSPEHYVVVDDMIKDKNRYTFQSRGAHKDGKENVG